MDNMDRLKPTEKAPEKAPEKASRVDRRRYRAISEILAGKFNAAVGSEIPADWPEDLIADLFKQNAIVVIK
jgi:hypothetical protein